ncbi:hypothetical protein [Arthrobacter sp. NPDC090010]|uniref:hypothetical protein n=1 Tax=Arthrobacter sp. NPDC090010 TaxID=3363942 RepID=UPI0038138641
MGAFTQGLAVSCDRLKIPASVHYDGREYRVCAPPSRWYTRRAQWAGNSGERNSGQQHGGEQHGGEQEHAAAPVDYEIWRVQLVRDLTGQELTLDLAHYTEPDRWRLIKVHDTPALHQGEPADDGGLATVHYADFTHGLQARNRV